MGGGVLKLSVRFCRLGRLYGPGMPDLGPEGLMEKPLKKPFGQVAMVSVHCWNLGEKTGPDRPSRGVAGTGVRSRGGTRRSV